MTQTTKATQILAQHDFDLNNYYAVRMDLVWDASGLKLDYVGLSLIICSPN